MAVISKAKNNYPEVDELQKNIGSTPRAQVSVTAKKRRINKMFICPKPKSFQELPYAVAYLKKCKGKEDAAYGDTKG
tara:strand:+ start:82 stop:312 length:231 start_codon:yes stop_codon:yes gene_type:complete